MSVTGNYKVFDNQPLDCHSITSKSSKDHTWFFFDLPENIIDTTITLTSGDLNPEVVKKKADLKKSAGIDSEIVTVYLTPYLDSKLVCSGAKVDTLFRVELARLSFD